MNMAASLDQSLTIFDYLPKAEPPSLNNSMSELASAVSSVRGNEDDDDEREENGTYVNSYGSSFPASASGTSNLTATSAASKSSTTVASSGATRKRSTANAHGSSDDKRQKKLELNRLASRESRKRKKRRLEELQRSVLYLTHENHQLREQNELLRQMLIGRLPTGTVAAALGNGEEGNEKGLLAMRGPGEMEKEEVLATDHGEGESLNVLGSMSSAAVDMFFPNTNLLMMKENVEGGKEEEPSIVGAA